MANLATPTPHSPAQTPDAPQTEREPQKKLDLSLTGVLGSSLAAITAAFFGAKLGVAGTIIGAGLGSIISAVAAALYTASLRRSRESLKVLTQTGRRREATNDVTTTPETAVGASPVRIKPNWRKVAIGAGVVFAVAIALITTYEMVSGKTLSGSDGGTSVTRVFNDGAARSPVDPSTPTDPAPGSTQPQQSTAPSTPSAPATETKPSAPSTTTSPKPSDAPTSQAPAPETAPPPQAAAPSPETTGSSPASEPPGAQATPEG